MIDPTTVFGSTAMLLRNGCLICLGDCTRANAGSDLWQCADCQHVSRGEDVLNESRWTDVQYSLIGNGTGEPRGILAHLDQILPRWS